MSATALHNVISQREKERERERDAQRIVNEHKRKTRTMNTKGEGLSVSDRITRHCCQVREE